MHNAIASGSWKHFLNQREAGIDTALIFRTIRKLRGVLSCRLAFLCVFFVEQDQTRAIREGKNFAKTLTCAIFFLFWAVEQPKRKRDIFNDFCYLLLVVKFEGFHVFNHESSPCLCFLIEDNSQNPYKVKSRYIFVLHSRQIKKKKSQSSLMKNPVTRAVPAPLFSPMLNCFYFHCLNQTFHRVKVNSKHHFRCKVLTITHKNSPLICNYKLDNVRKAWAFVHW